MVLKNISFRCFPLLATPVLVVIYFKKWFLIFILSHLKSCEKWFKPLCSRSRKNVFRTFSSPFGLHLAETVLLVAWFTTRPQGISETAFFFNLCDVGLLTAVIPEKCCVRFWQFWYLLKSLNLKPTHVSLTLSLNYLSHIFMIDTYVQIMRCFLPHLIFSTLDGVAELFISWLFVNLCWTHILRGCDIIVIRRGVLYFYTKC